MANELLAISRARDCDRFVVGVCARTDQGTVSYATVFLVAHSSGAGGSSDIAMTVECHTANGSNLRCADFFKGRTWFLTRSQTRKPDFRPLPCFPRPGSVKVAGFHQLDFHIPGKVFGARAGQHYVRCIRHHQPGQTDRILYM